MQNRMATHTLAKPEIEALLLSAEVGRIGTLNRDGYPYVVPVHYIYYDHKIYIHGLPAGKKLDNIASDPRVGFEVDEMAGLLTGGVQVPCDVNTEYRSVIIHGDARQITDLPHKEHILKLIIEKYAPHLVGKSMPLGMVAGTAVIEITVKECSGKYYR